jgi:hypothetical protein
MHRDVQDARSHAIRQGWWELCERVASQTELTEELASLTELLKLPLSCCLAVHRVLKEGNWAKADSPLAYIKKAAKTQGRKMHLAVPLKDDTLECGGAPLIFTDGNSLDRATTRESIEAALQDEYRDLGKPGPSRMKGKHFVPERFAPEEEPAESLFLPSDCWTELKVKRPGDSSFTSVKMRDWRKIGEKAGLDAWESRVLEYRSLGISRDSAMKLQPDEVSRKAIQAAWKRIDRTGMDTLREYLRKNSLRMSRKSKPRTLGK